MRNYNVNGLPGLFSYHEVVTRIHNARLPAPAVAPATPLPVLTGDALIRGEHDPVGSEVRLDAHPDFVPMFPRPARAPAVATTTTTTPTTGSGRGWLRTLGGIALGLFGLWFVFALLIPAIVGAFGYPSWNWKNGAIAEARAEASKAKADAVDAKLQAADAKKAAEEAQKAAALADAKAKGSVAQLNGIVTCPGGNKAACIALLKADGLPDNAADAGCAPSCVAATP